MHCDRIAEFLISLHIYYTSFRRKKQVHYKSFSIFVNYGKLLCKQHYVNRRNRSRKRQYVYFLLRRFHNILCTFAFVYYSENILFSSQIVQIYHTQAFQYWFQN